MLRACARHGLVWWHVGRAAERHLNDPDRRRSRSADDSCAGPQRRACRPGFHVLSRAARGVYATADYRLFVASRMPGCTRRPAAPADRLLGVRPTRPGREDDRGRARGARGAPRVRRPVPRALPDPPNAAGRRLRRERLRVDRSRQYLGLQLPFRHRLIAPVGARLWPCDRCEPDREPVRVSRRDNRARGVAPVPRPIPASTRNGLSGRHARAGIRPSRMAVGRRLASTVGDRLPTLLVHRTMPRPGTPATRRARGQTRLASTSLQ